MAMHLLLLLCFMGLSMTTGLQSQDTTKSTDKPRILSFGIAAVDFVASVDHFPTPDEKMRSTSLVIAGGGNAAHTACAMGRLDEFCCVDMATAVGKEANGHTIVQGLQDFGVGVEFIERIEGSSTPFSYILTTPDMARTIIHQPSSRDMSLDFADRIPLDRYQAVHMDARHPRAAVHLAHKCVQANLPYSLDVERPREGLEELLSQATVVICNSNYCDTVLGQQDSASTDAELIDRLESVMQAQAPNAQLIIQTMGSRGSCLIQRHDSFSHEDGIVLGGDSKDHRPTITYHDGASWCPIWEGCKLVDSTGAGDAFQGGFLTALWSYIEHHHGRENFKVNQVPSKALAHCLRIATRVAAKKLECPGARDGLPKASEDVPLQEEFEQLLST